MIIGDVNIEKTYQDNIDGMIHEASIIINNDRDSKVIPE